MELIEVLTDDEDIIDYIDYIDRPRRPYILRDRRDHFTEWDEYDFFARFRLQKGTVQVILHRIEDSIRSPTNRNHALTPGQMLLITIRFYATGTMLNMVGDFAGVHKSTTSKVIHKVSRALAHLAREFITFPNDEQGMNELKQGFYEIARFPRCIGALDCTHVKIQSPGGDNAEVYRNRKGFFSINVQTICDHNLKILDVVARWPGSAHDSNIFRNSNIMRRFENDEMGNNLLVGDSGYPIKNYLITPLANAAYPAEQLFNESQIRTRNPVERSYGVWKRRFPVLALGIRLKLNRLEAVIIATAVLHNIASYINEPEPPVNEQIVRAVNFVNDMPHMPYVPVRGDGGVHNATRFSLVHDYFQNLV